MKRFKVNKEKSAKEFRRNVSKTKAANVAQDRIVHGKSVMRGGWRL